MSRTVYQDRYATAEQKRIESAKELLGYHLSGITRWLFAHRRADNHAFFIVPGTSTPADPTPVYYTDLHDCTCPSHKKGYVACKHMLAVRMWFAAYKAGEIVLPGTATRYDTDVLEAASTIAHELDIANAADCLLDQYDAAQAKATPAPRVASNEAVDWWLSDSGAPVWLMEGDTYAPDSLVPAPVPAGGLMAGSDVERLQQSIDRLNAEDAAPVVYGEVSGEIYPRPARPVGLVTRYEDLFGDDDDHT